MRSWCEPALDFLAQTALRQTARPNHPLRAGVQPSRIVVHDRISKVNENSDVLRRACSSVQRISIGSEKENLVFLRELGSCDRFRSSQSCYPAERASVEATEVSPIRFRRVGEQLVRGGLEECNGRQ